MDCGNCDRNNVVKAYCYFSRRREYFREITGQDLTFESFAVFAVEMNLVWRISICPCIPRSEFVFYWHILEPYLIEAIKQFPDMSKIDIDWSAFKDALK